MASKTRRIIEWLGLADPLEDFDPELDVEAPISNQSQSAGGNILINESKVKTPPPSFAPRPTFDEPRPGFVERTSSRGGSDRSSDRGSDFDSIREPLVAPSVDRNVKSGLGNVKPINQQQGKQTVHIIFPKDFKDSTEVAMLLRDGYPVILNLQYVSSTSPRRVIDFCSGVTFVLDGHMERISHKIYLLTPPNVTVSQEEKERLLQRGAL
ncbi:MAG: cell division protein SepF [Actinomycetota bacterium]|nr:cell division protein SepF [Actinomycetota bacterium]